MNASRRKSPTFGAFRQCIDSESMHHRKPEGIDLFQHRVAGNIAAGKAETLRRMNVAIEKLSSKA